MTVPESVFEDDPHVMTWNPLSANYNPSPAVKHLLCPALGYSNLCIAFLEMQKGLPGDDRILRFRC